MSLFRSAVGLRSVLARSAHTTSTPAASTMLRYAHSGSSYGGGEGDPKGETPSQQGTSKATSNAEHPGPAPPKEGENTGGGPTKAGSDGGHHGGKPAGEERGSSGSSSDGGVSGSTSTGGRGAQPKISDHRPPHDPSEDVKKHNKEFANRSGKSEQAEKGEEKVGKDFWKGER
jgi:hypothetical protein